MKRSGFDHPKLGRLCKLLGVPRYAAVGIVESLWHFTAKHAPAGDVGKWSDDEIAEALCWDGDSVALVNALVESRLLDRSESHRLAVHDWDQHCDDSVHNCLARRVELFANGQQPKLSRIGDKERAKLLAAYELEKTNAEKRAASDLKRTANAQPSPALPSLAMPCPLEGAAEAAPVQAKAKPIMAADVEFPKAMDSPANREALDRWLKYKRGKRKSYKDAEHVGIMLAEFLKNNGSAAPGIFPAAVSYSIGQNYEGCFPPKNRGAPATVGAGQKYDPTQGELKW